MEMFNVSKYYYSGTEISHSIDQYFGKIAELAFKKNHEALVLPTLM